jgi:hypothetical protein
MKIYNSSFETVEEFRCVGTTLTNQSFIQEEIQIRFKSGNACCHSVQIFFVFQFALKNMKIKIYRIIILPFILYGCETWSLTLREERTRRLFKDRVLRRIFGPKRDKVTENEKTIS